MFSGTVPRSRWNGDFSELLARPGQFYGARSSSGSADRPALPEQHLQPAELNGRAC
jgi:hypothetical protein